jgi:hypothetical protein
MGRVFPIKERVCFICLFRRLFFNMDARVNEHLLNICSSLGGFENTGDSDTEARYVLGDECLGK